MINDSGKIFESKYGVLTPDLDRMAFDMQHYGVSELAMESTSIYWIPIWRVLEEMFDQKLVNPYFIKQLPGRKTDVKDAEWIATCVYKELIRGSYVPELIIQELRQYDRRIFDLNKEIAYENDTNHITEGRTPKMHKSVYICIFYPSLSMFFMVNI